MGAVVDLTTTSDADFRRSFQYAVDGGSPISLTGSTLRMMVRRRADEAQAFIDITSPDGGITITDADAGKFTIWLPFAMLSRMAAGEYVHSLIRTQGGVKDEVWHGTLKHSIGPTR